MNDLATGGLSIQGNLSAQQLQLRCSQRGDFRHARLRFSYAIKLLHQELRAAISNRPQAGDHGLCALALGQHAKAFDLFTIRAAATSRRVTSREREQFDSAEYVR